MCASITKPVAGTVLIAVDGVAQPTSAFHRRCNNRRRDFSPAHIPGWREVTAGFEFDVPVRFDTDYLAINLANFAARRHSRIPIVEVGYENLPAGLQAHLDSGATTLCRCWKLSRRRARRWASPTMTDDRDFRRRDL